MELAEVNAKVKEITAKVLKKDVAIIKDEDTFIGLGADSLKSLELVAAFEDGFDIEMEEDEATQVQNVGDAAVFIAKYL